MKWWYIKVGNCYVKTLFILTDYKLCGEIFKATGWQTKDKANEEAKRLGLRNYSIVYA